MASWFAGAPFWIAFLALFGIVLVRAQLTYWAGRGVVAGARRTRLAEKIDSPRTTRATTAVNRWGPPLVTVSFLTIGFQTAINAAAGLTRMPWPRYMIAMVPGCLAWAAIYATIGLAAVQAWIGITAGRPWAIAVLVVLIAAAGTTILIVRSRRASPRMPVDNA